MDAGKYTIGLGQEQMGFCGVEEDVASISLTVVSALLENNQVRSNVICLCFAECFTSDTFGNNFVTLFVLLYTFFVFKETFPKLFCVEELRASFSFGFLDNFDFSFNFFFCKAVFAL